MRISRSLARTAQFTWTPKIYRKIFSFMLRWVWRHRAQLELSTRTVRPSHEIDLWTIFLAWYYFFFSRKCLFAFVWLLRWNSTHVIETHSWRVYSDLISFLRLSSQRLNCHGFPISTHWRTYRVQKVLWNSTHDKNQMSARHRLWLWTVVRHFFNRKEKKRVRKCPPSYIDRACEMRSYESFRTCESTFWVKIHFHTSDLFHCLEVIIVSFKTMLMWRLFVFSITLSRWNSNKIFITFLTSPHDVHWLLFWQESLLPNLNDKLLVLTVYLVLKIEWECRIWWMNWKLCKSSRRETRHYYLVSLATFFSHFIEHCLCVLILSIFICSDTLHSLDGVERQPLLLSMNMSLETIYSEAKRHTEKSDVRF